MKESKFKSYDDLPLFLSAKQVAQMDEKDFPALHIGSRIVAPKDKLQAWVERQTGGEA